MTVAVQTKDLQDFVVAMTAESDDGEVYYVKFQAYEVVGRQQVNGQGDFVAPIFNKRNYSNSDETTPHLPLAQIYLSGTIKWDGCSDMHFDEQDNVCLHFCSRKDAVRIGKLMDELYSMALEFMPGREDLL